MPANTTKNYFNYNKPGYYAFIYPKPYKIEL
jgi:hypothetical protein